MFAVSLMALGALWQGCTPKTEEERAKKPVAASESEVRGHDPLPGELVAQALREDSVRTARKAAVKRHMTEVIANYRKRFQEPYFNGYFLTDFDDDEVPELWVKVGSYHDNSRLELYYPMPDGTLSRSDVQSEPGQYYVGDGYMMQVVGDGPGVININRITIRRGQMYIENVKQLDIHSNPGAQMPKFSETEKRYSDFTNLSTLYNAFN